jgi:hypothetical protein
MIQEHNVLCCDRYPVKRVIYYNRGEQYMDNFGQAPQQSSFIKPKMIDENCDRFIDIKHSLHVTLQFTEYSRCFGFFISPSPLSL